MMEMTMRKVLLAVAAVTLLSAPPALAQGKVDGVAQSDDYDKYGPLFEKAAAELIAAGRCKAADFKEMGGFTRSTNRKPEVVYFTYCGRMHVDSRIYVKISKGSYVIES